MPHAKELFPLGEPNESRAVARAPAEHAGFAAGARPRAGADGLWLAFGHGHWGLTLGPVTGRLIADMMTGATPFTDPAPYRAERFM